MEINGYTRMAAVLAQPIKHSLSPFIHNLAFELTDENAVYLAWELEDEKMLKQTINNVRTLDMYGLNISMPYKQKAVEFIDELSEEAELIGAVNTIVNQKGKLVGYNTDGQGFFSALNFKPRHKKITLIGGGGAAISIIVQAALLEMQEITVFARQSASYAPLEQRLKKLSQQTKITIRLYNLADRSRLQKEITTSDLLVNATPVGMAGEAMPLPSSILLPPGILVVDTIYKVRETPLMKWAKSQERATMNGVGMLIHQAATSFELWTGKKMPVEQISQKLEEKDEVKC
ncbi:shikimate dehydrogenase [Lactococcus garvieae]|uniref:shikimate dehydrogenase n=1 Tax=Lactococcus garvieae TaxID=1363 RepID=UPI0002669B3C|nr:shikimate dehydrogenase [Lactococcus garvieae]MDN5628212.1 shikimate dehydrogenase [Lactococcus sp.]EIT66674.1 Shikimate dehydrogenase [Lactococcus garvieae IPLA 31405]MBS4463104.1 shikimate dehydrogenase [Lactococcus garvieae]UHU65403.1 shikimate dehydrogenase [Lactococcus garvieae]HCS85901.1 shikimate dehydrogenase [Lactococcus garvieae]